jgi:hypothetical protein
VTKEGEAMLENALDKIAEQIIALDEASLTQLRKLYLDRLFNFAPTKKWEKAVIIYFLINGVIAKNNLFNHHILEGKKGETPKGTEDKGAQGGKSKRKLKVVK